jgi:uncharacterized protein YjiS (DUF1127 family)
MDGQIYGKTLTRGAQSDPRRIFPLRRFEKALGAAFDRLLTWHEQVRSRRMLRGLDDHMLRDIGIDRAAAEQEGSAPFWR